MELITIKPRNVCSTEMRVWHENNVITKAEISHGCRGNTQGLCALLVGRTLEEASTLLDGIQCRNGTSCPDQLAKGLKEYLNK